MLDRKSGPDGAYSIALSGGYEDDLDLGDCFTYTGNHFLTSSWSHIS